MAKAAPKRGKNKDNARRSKKKISLLTQEKVEFVDYKDINMLRRFMSDRAKIRARRVSGNDSQQQKEIARAIKNAREMALLPYTKRTVSTRAPRPGKEGREDEANLELDEQPTSSSFVPREDEDDSTDSTEAVAEETAAVEAEVEA